MIKRQLIGSTKQVIQMRNHAFNLDTVLLAKFLKLSKKMKTLLDIGTGNGALLIYASEMTRAHLIGVEIQQIRYNLAVQNMNLNQLEHRTTLIHGNYLDTDFNNLDCIITNPPFFHTTNEKHLNDDLGKTMARHELSLPLESLIEKASKQLKYGGYFYMIHRPDRLTEIMDVLQRNHLTVKRIKFVHPYEDKKANHVLIGCIKHGNQGVIVESPLIIYQHKHIYSDAFKSYIQGERDVT